MPTSVNIEEVRKRIAVLNAQSAQINNTRSVNFGRKQTLESQLENLLRTYNEKYGVQLSSETLEAEISKVVAEKEAECNKLTGVLEAINAQDYDRANSLLGIEVKSENEVSTSNEVIQSSMSDLDVNQNVEKQVVVQEPSITTQVQTVEVAVSAPTPVVSQPSAITQPVGTTTTTQPVGTTQPIGVTQSVGTITQPVGAITQPVTQSQPEVTAPSVEQQITAPVTPPASKLPQMPSGLTGTEFMSKVQDTEKAPMPALKGFTKGVGGLSGLGTPNLDVAQPTGAVQQPKSFGDILGGTGFMNS